MVWTPLLVIDWPFLVLAVVAGVLVLTWPAYRRLTRACNTALAEGDVARSLDLALRIQRSRLPMLVLERLLMRGHAEANIATRCYLLGEVADALDWAVRGLRIARRPHVRARLHFIAAQAAAERCQLENLGTHLAKSKAIIAKHPSPDLDYAVLAAACHYNAGQLDGAFEVFRNAVSQSQGVLSARLTAVGLFALGALGRFQEVFGLTRWMLEDEESAAAQAPESSTHTLESSLAVDKLRQSDRRAIESYTAFAAMSAAEWAERWDLYERYLKVTQAAANASPRTRLILLGYQGIWAAHNGRADEVDALVAAMRELTARYPRDRRLQDTQSEMLVRVWHHLEAHERVAAEFENAALHELPPIDQSRLATLAADSLDALGQNEKARACRQEAKRLAPLAWWNQDPADQSQFSAEPLALFQTEATSGTPETMARTKPMLEDGPVAPVASGLACAVWVTAVFALVPILAIVAAPVLAILSVLLLVRREPLAHDRRVALAGLALAGWSLSFHAAGIVHHVARPRTHWHQREQAFTPAGFSEVEEVLDTQPGEDDEPALASQPGADGEARPGADEHPTIDTEEERPDISADSSLSWPQQILVLAVLVASIMLHEIGHALASFWSGDPTAKQMGRLSLNPIRHIDLFGSIIVPIVLTILPGSAVIGWAKPVPFKQHRLRNPRRGRLAVALAGVSVNLLIALVATSVLGLLLLVLVRLYPDTVFGFALIRLGPLHLPAVSHEWIWVAAIELCKAAILVNGLLAGFNLLPIPPLDGFHLLQSIAPRPLAAVLGKVSGVGMVLLFVLIALGALKFLLVPAIWTSVFLLFMALVYAGVPI